MYKIHTPDGERFLVQLVGPRSYRMGSQMTLRGQTLPVTKRTRDYLVRKTEGAWADYDPTPPEPIDEVLPPQFGETGGPMIDMNDIDPKKNPALSMEHAQQLAAKGEEHHVDVTAAYGAQDAADAGPVEIDTADLGAKPQGAPETPDEAGDITGKEVKGATKASGGSAKAKGQAKPKGGVTIKNQPKPAEPEADTAGGEAEAMTVS